MAASLHPCPRRGCDREFESKRGVDQHVDRTHRRKNDTKKKAGAIAEHLVDGKTLEEVAEGAGVSPTTISDWVRAYREGRLPVDDFLSEYRARLLPALAELQSACTERALKIAPTEKSVLKVTLAAKAAGEMASKAAGEADLTVNVNAPDEAKARVLEAIARRREQPDETGDGE